MAFLPNPPEAGKSLRYAQKIILAISIICLWLFFRMPFRVVGTTGQRLDFEQKSLFSDGHE